MSLPSFGRDEERELIKVLRSNWVTTGPVTKRFEDDFAEYVGARYAMATASGTAALHLSILAIDLKPGDEIITPSLTWTSAINMMVNLGVKPVFADIDARTLNLDAASVRKKITRRTRALLPVHFAGNPCDMNALKKLAKQHELVIIEDSAHAVGTTYRNKKIGSLSLLSCFSFHPIKNITTGEGGMVTTNNKSLFEKLKLFKFHGVTRDSWKRYGSQKLPHYEVVLPGYKYNLTDLQAALGICQLKKLEDFIEKRTALAELYFENLRTVEEIILPPRCLIKNSRHAWNLFTIRIVPELAGCTREDFMTRLLDKGVATGLHFLPVHLQPYYRQTLGHKDGDLPKTEDVCANILSLPLYSDLSERDAKYVCRAIKEVLSGRRTTKRRGVRAKHKSGRSSGK